jgi:hypothetical protein
VSNDLPEIVTVHEHDEIVRMYQEHIYELLQQIEQLNAIIEQLKG